MPGYRMEDIGDPFGPVSANALSELSEADIAERKHVEQLPSPIRAAFETENIAVAATMRAISASRERQIPAVEGYNPFEDPAITADPRLRGLEDAFSESVSPMQTLAIKSRMERGMDSQESLSRAGGLGVALVIGASIADPINLVPGIGAGVKAKTATGAFAAGAAAAFSSGMIEEGLLQRIQDERPDIGLEGAMTMLAFSSAIGALGGGLKAISNKRLGLIAGEMKRNMETRMGTAERVIQSGWVWDEALDEAENFSRWDKIAREVAPEMSELAAKGTVRGNIIETMFKASPIRVASSKSPTGRSVLKVMSDTRGVLTKFENTGGTFGPPVETLAEGWRTFRLTAGVSKMVNEFTEYRKAGGQEITRQSDFFEAVGRAWSRGDTAADEVLEPAAREAVARAAKQMRETVFNPMWKRAVDAGLYRHEDADLLGTAESYAPRVYDRHKIAGMTNAKDETFRQALANWLRRNPDKIKKGETPESLATKFEHTILNTDRGTVHMGLVREGGPLRDRALLVPDEIIEPWLNRNAQEVAARYINTLAGESELAHAFQETLPPEIKALQGRLDQLSKDLGDLERAGNTAQDIAEQIENQKAISVLERGALKESIVEAVERQKLVRSEIDGLDGQIKTERAKGRISRRAMDHEIDSLTAERKGLRRRIKELKELEGKFEMDPEMRALYRAGRVDAEFNLRHAKRRGDHLAQMKKTVAPEEVAIVEGIEARRAEAQQRYDGVRGELQDLRAAAKVVDADIRETVTFSKQQLQTARTMEDLAGQLDRDLSEVRRNYARRGANLQPQIEQVMREYDELIDNASTEKERVALKRQQRRDIEDIKLMRDRIIGSAGIPENPDSLFYRVSQTLKRWNLARLSGTFGVSQITDMAHIPLVWGFRDAGEVVKSMATGLKNVRKDELAENLWSAEVVQASRRSMRLADIQDEYVGGTKLEKFTKVVSDEVPRIVGIDHANGFMKAHIGLISGNRVLKLSKKWVDGTLPEREMRRMTQAGIDQRMAKRIASMSEHWEADETGKHFVSHADKWTDIEAARTFETAVHAIIRNTIIEPGVADLPRIMSDPMLSSIMQFKSFIMTSTYRITASALNEPDQATLAALTGLVGWGGLMYAIKTVNAGREFPDTNAGIMFEAIDHSGALGFAMELHNMGERVSGFGLHRALGGQGPSRYRSRNAVDAILGPSVGGIADSAQALHALGGLATGEELSKADTRAFRKALPIQNAPGIRQLLDHAEEVISK